MSQGRLSLADLVDQRRREDSRRQRRGRHQANWLDDTRFSRWHVPDVVDHEPDNWLITYLDMLTLLLAMLVVMLGVSHVSAKTSPGAEHEAVALVGSVDFSGKPGYDGYGKLGSLPDIPAAWAALPLPGELPPRYPADVGPLPRDQAPEPEATQAEMAAAAEAAGLSSTPPRPPGALPPSPPLVPPSIEELGLSDLGKSVEVMINDQSVSFRINNELLFPSGQATLSPDGLDVLKRLATVVNRSKYPLSVEGHSDNVRIQTPQFPSNWELSSSRATSVLRELTRNGVDPQRLRAVGYADTRPIKPNDTAEGRSANRRVELILQITPKRPDAPDSVATAPAAQARNR